MKPIANAINREKNKGRKHLISYAIIISHVTVDFVDFLDMSF